MLFNIYKSNILLTFGQRRMGFFFYFCRRYAHTFYHIDNHACRTKCHCHSTKQERYTARRQGGGHEQPYLRADGEDWQGGNGW